MCGTRWRDSWCSNSFTDVFNNSNAWTCTTGHSWEQSVLLLTFFKKKPRVYTVCMTDVTSVFLFERMLVMVCVCVCALVMIPCFTAFTFVDLLNADLGSSSCTVHNSWHFWIKAWYFYYYYFFSFFFFLKCVVTSVCLSISPFVHVFHRVFKTRLDWP